MDINIKLMVTLNKMSYYLLDSLSKDLQKRGLCSSEYSILAHLNAVKKEKTQKLGQISYITSGTITHIVTKLIKSGYVTKEVDEFDKRIFWVKITQKGRNVFNKIHTEHIEYLSELLSDFSEEEKNQFITQLKYFGKTIENKIKGE